MQKLKSTICLVCLIILTTAEINIRNASFYTVGGNFSHLLNPSVYMTSSSVINSCSLCMDVQDCSSFLFNSKTQQMQIMASIGTPIVTAEGDWQYYILKKGKYLFALLAKFQFYKTGYNLFCQKSLSAYNSLKLFF